MIYILSVVGLVVLTAVVYYFCEGKGDLKKAKKEFELFGLESGFTPQGLCFVKSQKWFLVSGYMKNKNLSSRIYVVSCKDNSFVKYVTIKKGKTELKGHFGGIANFGDNVWISSDGEVLRISLEKIKIAKDSEKIEILDSFESKNGADFCFVNSGVLWIGEFYKLWKYKTDITHHVRVGGKLNYHSMCFGYKIDPGSKYGILKPIPEKALSIPDIIQDIEICNNKIFTSSSYGISKSNISVFRNVLNEKPATKTYFDESKIPLYVLSPSLLEKRYVLPEMSEGISVYSDRLYILFESAAKKYRLLTRKRLKNSFSISLNNL